MRVTGGELAGRRFPAPPRRSAVRPTGDRVRESLFAVLGSLDGVEALDLFCGTGALGIEALSRGAPRATLVDRDPALAEASVRELGLEERARVLRADLRRNGPWDAGERFGLILCDPPWAEAVELLAALEPALLGSLAPGGRLVIESSAREPVDFPLEKADERRYGETLVRIHVAE